MQPDPVLVSLFSVLIILISTLMGMFGKVSSTCSRVGISKSVAL